MAYIIYLYWSIEYFYFTNALLFLLKKIFLVV